MIRVVLLLAAIGYAQVTKTICATGADYTTIGAFETAYSTNIAGLGEVRGMVCAGTYSENLTFTGTTGASATDYLNVMGVTQGAILNATSGTGTTIQTAHTRFTNMELRSSGSTVVIYSAGAAGVILDRCIINQTQSGTKYGVGVDGSGATMTIRSSLVKKSTSTGAEQAIYTATNAALMVRNTTVNWDNGSGKYLFQSLGPGSSVTLANVAFFNDGADALCINTSTNSPTVTMSYTATSDATSSGTGSLQNVTSGQFGFTDGYHITKSSILWGVGSNQSAFGITQDVDGDYWTTTGRAGGTPLYSIGADNPGPFVTRRCGKLFRMGVAPCLAP